MGNVLIKIKSTEVGTLNSHIFIDLGTATEAKLNDDIMCAELSDYERLATLELYCLTGCDSVSCFMGKGKVKAFTNMLSEKKYVNAFKALGVDCRKLDLILTISERNKPRVITL